MHNCNVGRQERRSRVSAVNYCTLPVCPQICVQLHATISLRAQVVQCLRALVFGQLGDFWNGRDVM